MTELATTESFASTIGLYVRRLARSNNALGPRTKGLGRARQRCTRDRGILSRLAKKIDSMS